MEEPQVAPGEQDADSMERARTTKEDAYLGNQTFDPENYAALLEKDLIAYKCSWDPLLMALKSLGFSMQRQQHEQKSNNDAMQTMQDELASLRERLDRSEADRQSQADAASKLQEQVSALTEQLKAVTDQQAQQQDAMHQMGERLDQVQTSAAESKNSPQGSQDTKPDPQDPAAASTFATAQDLNNLKRSLTKRWKRSLSAVFGPEHVVDDDEVAEQPNNHQDASTEADIRPPSAGPVTSIPESHASIPESHEPENGWLKTPLPGVPFASEAMVKQELAVLRDLQTELRAKLGLQQQRLDQLKDSVTVLESAADPATESTATKDDRADGSVAPESARSMDGVQKQIDAIRAVQDEQRDALQSHQQELATHTSNIKALGDGLDDLRLHHQLVEQSQGGGGEGGDKASGQPHLDLSLVFTKIADLRKTTEGAVDELKHDIADVSATTQSHQQQLDALRNAAIFGEHQQLRLLEAQLAMQKDWLHRNQGFQDKSKPQLAEWRRAMEQTEEKLVQGMCDQDVMDELQQFQRNYHRTMLTLAPIINSPQAIAESLEVLASEVRELQTGVQAGVVPLPIRGEESNRAREDEFLKKLRYLDEEASATKQVNTVTEKKNEPMLKALDAMREKLDVMWSLWHQNYAIRKSGTDPAVMATGSSESVGSSASSGPRASPDALRELELRVMGAVRRLGTMEDELERLAAAADSATPEEIRVRTAELRKRPDSEPNEQVEKLREDMNEEIARLSSALSSIQASVANPGRSNSIAAHSASTGAHGDPLGDLAAQMKRQSELDGRFLQEIEGMTGYEALLKEVTKRATQAVLQQAEKNGMRANPTGPAGISANPNVNYRAMLENFTQRVEDRLEDSREYTTEELNRLRKELADLIKARIEAALRDLRAEFLPAPMDPTGDSTSIGSKPVMCVACSRPVPVNAQVRESALYPPAEAIAEQANALLATADLEYDRTDDDFIFRGGFKMPADRKTMTLPFLANSARNRVALSKLEHKPRRPTRQNGTEVEAVVREAMELDKKQRPKVTPSPPK